MKLERRIQDALRHHAPRGRDTEQIGPFLATFTRDTTNPYLNYAIPDEGGTADAGRRPGPRRRLPGARAQATARVHPLRCPDRGGSATRSRLRDRRTAPADDVRDATLRDTGRLRTGVALDRGGVPRRCRGPGGGVRRGRSAHRQRRHRASADGGQRRRRRSRAKRGDRRGRRWRTVRCTARRSQRARRHRRARELPTPGNRRGDGGLAHATRRSTRA